MSQGKGKVRLVAVLVKLDPVPLARAVQVGKHGIACLLSCDIHSERDRKVRSVVRVAVGAREAREDGVIVGVPDRRR